jgi:hypothetical protein
MYVHDHDIRVENEHRPDDIRPGVDTLGVVTFLAKHQQECQRAVPVILGD